MKTLDAIRHITQHPEYKNVVINVGDTEETPDLTPMGAIGYLASIDPSNYEDYRYQWRLEGSLEKDTLLIYVA